MKYIVFTIKQFVFILLFFVFSQTVFAQQPLGNRGMYFNGTNSYVSTSFVSAPANITLEAWVKLEDVGASYAIISNTPEFPIALNGYTLDVRSDGRIWMRLGSDGSADFAQSATVLVPKKWYHIAGTYDGTNLQVFVNGVLDGTGFSSRAITTTNAFAIGNFVPNLPYRTFKGQIDEVRIFNTVRTAAEIATDMATQTANGAVAYWNFDQSTGTTANDISGNGNNGTLANTPLWALRTTNTLDDGSIGSLRWAITQANLDIDRDYIDFSIGTGTQTISCLTSLPNITTPVVLDGTSKEDYALFSQMVQINNGASVTVGLSFSTANASNSVLKGLQVTNFLGSSGVSVSNANNIQILNNLISGNTNQNIIISNADATVIRGNRIGTDLAGNAVLGTNIRGILLSIGATNTIIGGAGAGEGNLISGNAVGGTYNGIRIQGGNNSTIYGNLIGVNANRTAFIPNSTGIAIADGLNNVIGGLLAGQANVIAGNSSSGISYTGGTVLGNTYIGNEIFCNTPNQMTLSGGNNNQAPPVITSATILGNVSGTGIAGDVIHLYKNPSGACNAANTQQYLGTATVLAGGTWDMTGLSLALGDVIVGTQTNASNGSSGYSTTFSVSNPPTSQPLGNRGLYFDGVDDVVTIPNNASFNFAGNVAHTISFWLKTTIGIDRGILTKAGSGGLQIAAFVNAAGQIGFAHDKNSAPNGGWDVLTTNNAVVENNKWVHISLVSDGTSAGKKIYVNSSLVPATTTFTVAGANFVAASAAAGNISFGFGLVGGVTLGQLDEVRFYSGIARLPADILTDMSTQTANGAAGYWNFDQSTGIIATNLGTAGVAANGTVSNIPANPLWALHTTNTLDDGSVGSLRWAITQANLDIDRDYIDFSIDNTTPTTRTIAPTSSFIVTQPIIIDGYSAFGSSPNTANLSSPNNAVLRIELNFSGMPSGNHGVVLDNINNSLIKGLSIYGVPSSGGSHRGINIQNTSSANTIEGCYIGLFADGNPAAQNMNGIGLDGNGSNIVGWSGTLKTAAFNIISNSQFNGIAVGSNNNIIQGNFIGLKRDGTGAGNNERGLLVNQAGNQILNNVISSNGTVGVDIRDNSTGTIVKGNKIGTDPAGTGNLGNSDHGVQIFNNSNNSIIGSTLAGEANIIAFNGNFGVYVDNSTSDLISGNQIFQNANGGISLVSGGNNGKAVPVVSSASATLISGTCQSGDVVEVFSDNPQFGATNQGRTFLGTAVTAGTSWTFSGLFTNGDRITATATDASNNTSTFSNAFVVSAGIPSQPLGNRGMYFDGVDDYVNIGNVLGSTFQTEFTAEAWIKPTRTGTDRWNVIFSKWSVGNGASDIVFTHVENSGNSFLLFADVNGINITTPLNSITFNKWHHVAVVYKQTPRSYGIYIDGVLQASGTSTALQITNTNTIPLRIGAIFNGAVPDGVFTGQMDEVRIFNTVRTPSNILLDMATQTANGAVAYWNFDQSTGTTANDISGNGNNGTLATAPTNPLWALRVTDNTDNSGAGLGSLRQAITEANTDTDTDYIDFSIQQTDATITGIRTITMASSALPVITQPIFIDGYSAFGSSPNTANFLLPNNSQLRIELNCINIGEPLFPAPLNSGLKLSASNSTVRGLSIFGVPGASSWGSQFGINIATGGTGNTIEGCYVGMKADGSVGGGMNGVGIETGATGNTVGGLLNSSINIVSGQLFDGFQLSGTNNTIRRNYVGTDKTGNLTGFGNGGRGITVSSQSNNIIGNLVSGNGALTGIHLQVDAGSSTVKGNYVGVKADLSGGLGNTGNGILITADPMFAVNNIVVGGTAAGEANTIAYNTNFGIQVDGIGLGAVGNKISRNNIYNNATGGISLVSGGNNGKAVPVVSSATPSLISGTCQSGDIVEIFNDSPQSGATDQGRTYLGNATVVGTNWTYSGTFANGVRITATATDASNNTSPFSVAATIFSPLSINTLNPTRNALNIATNAPIITNLSTTVVTPTLNNQIKVIGSQTGFYTAGTISGTNPVTIPAQNFKAGETITVEYLTTLLGTGGETLVSPQQYQFTAAATGVGNFVLSDFNLGANLRNVRVADMNNDNKLDLIFTNASPTPNQIRVYLNNGAGSYTLSGDYGGASPNGISRLFVSDFNADGFMDVAATNYGGQNVTILIGDGFGGFSSVSNTAGLGSVLTGCIGGDFDGDGDIDLAVSKGSTDEVAILLNNGSGTFTLSGAYIIPSSGANPIDLFAGDLDNDGDLDIASSNFSNSNCAIFLNNGSAVFTVSIFSTGAAGNMQGIDGKDLDNDGDIDLAVTSVAASKDVRFFSNNGSGVFTAAGAVISTSGGDPYDVRIGDMDGDGKPDVLVSSNTENKLYYLKNNGSFSFTQALFNSPNGGTFLDLGDMDGDADLDVITDYGTGFSVFLNKVLPPVALAATAVTTTGFTANWTNTGAISYNIDITTDPTFTIFTTTGSATNGRTFSSLTAGTTYYYRVRNFGDVVNSDIRTVVLPPTKGAGRALDLTAINTYVQADKFDNTFGSGVFSVEAWVKDDGSVDRTIVHSSSLTTVLAQHNYWRFYISTGDLHLDMGNSGVGVTQATSGVAIPAGQWTHVAVTRNAAGDITFYVNGIPYLGGNTTINASNGGTLRIGATRGSINIPSANVSDVPTNKLNGEIDELRLWNTGLSQGNIRDNMCQKLVGNEANLLGYFRFDEATGNTTENRATGSKFEGTLFNAPTRIISGAALGDISTHRYTTAGTASLADFSAFFATGGISNGIQVYKVNESPNSTTVNPSAINTLETSQYFGVFGVNIPSFNVTYDYTSNMNINGVANEPKARLYTRLDGATSTWDRTTSSINTVTKTITLAGQTTNQFIAGFRNFVSVPQPGSGKALSFNGNNQYVNLGAGLDLAGSSFTMEAWVKIPTNSFTHQNTILGKNINLTTTSYRFNIDNAGRLGLWVGDGMTSSAFLAPTPIPPNQWTHVAAVYDNSMATLTLYINGNVGNSTGTSITGLVSSPLPTLIGSLNLGAANFFEGEIDEVRIWDIARTQAQIRDNMCQKLATPSLLPNLKGYYRLDEGTGSITEDRASAFGDGTLVNAPTWVTSGAAIGDISGNTYDAGIFASVNDGDNFLANFGSITLGQGVHVYKVRETPNNVTLPAGISLFETSRYFGIYKVNVPNATISYEYSTNTNINGHPEEFNAVFSERDDNADATWSFPLSTNFAATIPNKYLNLVAPVTAIQRELMVGFTNSVPATQASNIIFNSQTSNSIGLQWTNGSGTNRIVVASTSPNFTPPINGTNYTVGQTIGTGKVVYNSSGNITLVNGLTPQTKYYFFVYEYNSAMSSPLYNTASAMNNPNSINTIATTPASQPTNLVTTPSPTGISGSFAPAVPAVDGYIGMIRTPNSQAIPPTDGTEYNVGTVFPPSQNVVFVGNNLSFTLSGLEPATEYILEIYAYNGTGNSTAYKKDNPLTIKFTTPALLPELIAITPNIKNVGDKGFFLQVIGKNFIPKTTLLWAGRNIPTNFISKTELSATIEESLLLDAGGYLITATSPSPGGGVSNALPFTVIPTVAIKNIPLISTTVAPDKNDHLLYRLEFISYGGETTLKQIKMSTRGTYQTADLKGDAFTLYYSTDENLDGNDTNLGTLSAIPSGLSMTFDVSKLVNKVRFPKNKTAYLLLAVNIAKEPTLGREIQINSLKFDDIEFEGIVTKQGLDPTQAGVTQKIVDAKPTPQDYSALIQFFNDMKGKDWVNAWNLNAPVNTWKGVELDENGNVIAISLANNNLVGKLSDAVMIDGVLISKSLRYLNLSGNKIEGIMPINIGNLTNLEYLDISNNSILGELPNQIGKLTNLITLWAGYNKLGSISIDFSNMKNLRNLFLPANNLTTLPDNLFNLKQLETLDLKGNKLKTLPASLAELSKLKFLDVSNNELVELPQGVSNLTDLEIFFAHNNKLPALPNSLTNLSKLQQFTIEGNFLTFGTLESIRQWWSSTSGVPPSKTSVLYAPQGKIGKIQEITALIGTPITLSIATSGTANTYQWFKNGKPLDNTNKSSYAISSVVADDGGIYTVNVISALVPKLVLQSNNIILLTDCSKATSAPKPVISVGGNVVFCGSEPVNARLSITESTSIASYKWFLNGVEINNSDRSNIIARDAGRYKVQVQTTSGCSLISDDLAIFLFPEYTVTVTQTQANLIANSSDRQLVSYEWLLGNTVIEGANGQTFIPQQQGTYRARVTDINGCRSTSLPINVSVVTAVENDLYEGQLTIYPNPSEGVFFLEIGMLLSKEKVSKIEVFNALGKFSNQNISLSSANKYVIDLKNQAAGLYFVRITTQKGSIIQKIIKE